MKKVFFLAILVFSLVLLFGLGDDLPCSLEVNKTNSLLASQDNEGIGDSFPSCFGIGDIGSQRKLS